MLCLFVLWEIYVPLREPLIPMHLFRSGKWVSSVVLLGLGAGVYYAFAIILPIQALVLYGDKGFIHVGLVVSVVGYVYHFYHPRNTC